MQHYIASLRAHYEKLNKTLEMLKALYIPENQNSSHFDPPDYPKAGYTTPDR